MQNILAKRSLPFLSNSKSQLHSFFIPSFAVFALSKSSNLSLTQSQNFCYSIGNKEKGFQSDFSPSYENIVNSLSNAENAYQIIESFHVNGSFYKNDQVVLSMRMLGRLIRTIPRSDSFANDERFISLQEKMRENLDTFNDHGNI